MPQRQWIAHSLVLFLDQHLAPDPRRPLTAETELLDTGLLDSLLMMDLVAHIEQEHGIRLEPEDITPRNFRTLELLARLVEQRSGAS